MDHLQQLLKDLTDSWVGAREEKQNLKKGGLSIETKSRHRAKTNVEQFSNVMHPDAVKQQIDCSQNRSEAIKR